MDNPRSNFLSVFLPFLSLKRILCGFRWELIGALKRLTVFNPHDTVSSSETPGGGRSSRESGDRRIDYLKLP